MAPRCKHYLPHVCRVGPLTHRLPCYARFLMWQLQGNGWETFLACLHETAMHSLGKCSQFLSMSGVLTTLVLLRVCTAYMLAASCLWITSGTAVSPTVHHFHCCNSTKYTTPVWRSFVVFFSRPPRQTLSFTHSTDSTGDAIHAHVCAVEAPTQLHPLCQNGHGDNAAPF